MANAMYPDEPSSQLGNEPAAAEGAKRSKASVKYSLGGEHCHACQFFIEAEHEDNGEDPTEPGECQKVEGRIGGHMWCNLFQWIPGANTKVA